MNLNERNKLILLGAGILLVVGLIALQRSRVKDDTPPQIDKEEFFRQINERYGEVDSAQKAAASGDSTARRDKKSRKKKESGSHKSRKGKKQGKSEKGGSTPINAPSRDPLKERL